MRSSELKRLLADRPRVRAGHWPTPLEPMPRLSAEIGVEIWVKRDDLSGFALGGNKIRQLEYYVGDAIAGGADTLLITGAVQSNFVRSTTAFAARFGLACHVQLEERVPDASRHYQQSGNALLDRLFGAVIHHFPVGEDEAAADQSLEVLAGRLRQQGHKPYVIHLGAEHPPLGALGYLEASAEIVDQWEDADPFDAIYVASGSASTHCGLLFGLSALEIDVPVHGICVRRSSDLQQTRVLKRCDDLAGLLEINRPFAEHAVSTDDRSLGPGYGRMTAPVREAIAAVARCEGMLVDPVYTGRVMAALIERERGSGRRILFWHTGGEPALFAYADQL